MTCIVGIAQGGKVHIGGDAIGSDGYSASIVAQPKVFARNGIVFGYTTSFRFGQLLEHALDVPARNLDEALPAYVFRLCGAIRQCLTDNGWMGKNEERDVGGSALIGIDGRLYTIQGDFAALEMRRNYAAVGCGADYALGALAATEGGGEPVARVLTALRASVALCALVRPPFTVITGRAGVVDVETEEHAA